MVKIALNSTRVMQRPLLFRLFTLLMAVVVLTTSTGFGVIERSCLMLGQKTYSLRQKAQPDACTKPHPQAPKPDGKPAVQKQPCCDDQTHYEHVSFAQVLAQKAADLTKTVADAAVKACVWLANGLVRAVLSLVDAPEDSSQAAVPLSGRDLLRFVRTLLI